MQTTGALIAPLTLTVMLMLSAIAHCDERPLNYIEYSSQLSSSGQPTEAQFPMLAKAGFERVFYLAFADDDGALANEDRVARDLGMQFVQLPVVWAKPELRDFDMFAAAMAQNEFQKTLVHCQLNWRASSFVFLYRVLYQGVAMDDAFLDMRSVWSPSKAWQDFIFSVLAAHQVSPDCALCDWQEN